MSPVTAVPKYRRHVVLFLILLASVACLLPSRSRAASVTLRWTDNSNNESGFQIERQILGGVFLPVATVAANVTTYTDNSLAALTTYAYRVRAYNSHGSSAFSAAVTTKTPADPVATPPNTSPTLAALPGTVTPGAQGIASVALTIGDRETAAGSLVVSVTSSNTDLLPNSSLHLGGSGPNRVLVLSPVARKSGRATVTVTVSDGKLSTTRTFVLDVPAVNQPPSISALANLTTKQGTITSGSFTIGDQETSPGSLVVTASSSNTTLLSSSQIFLGGTGATRMVVLSPTVRLTGSATVTLSVSDGTHVTRTSFILNVVP